MLKNSICKNMILSEEWIHANKEKVNWKYFMSEGRRQKGFELLISNYKINQKISEFKN